MSKSDPIVILSAARTPLGSYHGALRRIGGRRGVASLCIGGGEATAVAIEMEGGVACGARRPSASTKETLP